MSVTFQLLVAFLIVSAMMAVLWLVQRVRNDAGVVDVGWCGGLALLSLFFGLTSDGFAPRRYLVMILGFVWAARLTLYILFNRVLGKEEDGRYQSLRRKYGERAQLFFFFFFQAQAVLDVLFGVPILVVAWSRVPHWQIWDLLGVMVWVVAVLGEGIADMQLARFRANPAHRGKTCRVGLWRYSRHPNYFFEWLHWWTYVLLAVGAGGWWATLLGPSVMLLFLFKVTGIPATEAQALASRGEDYRRYQETTSAFIPWFPKGS